MPVVSAMPDSTSVWVPIMIFFTKGQMIVRLDYQLGNGKC